jgi:hypothetical protein
MQMALEIIIPTIKRKSLKYKVKIKFEYYIIRKKTFNITSCFFLSIYFLFLFFIEEHQFTHKSIDIHEKAII